MVRISIESHRRLRILVGTLLLLIAAAMVVNARMGDFPLRLPGFLLLAGALALLSWRNHIEIDTTRRRLARRAGVLYPFVRSHFDLDSVRRLTLASVTRTSAKGNETTTYVIRVAGEAGGTLCGLGEMWPARLLTEQLCRRLGVEMENRLLGGASIRAATDLDTPLAERWRLAGIHRDAPQLPPESGLSIEHGEDFSEFSAPVEPFPRAITALVSIALLVGFHALNRWTDAPGFMLLIFAGAVIFFGGGLIAQHSGRNRVRFSADTVEFRRGAIVRQRLALARIEELLSNEDELVLMGDDAYLVLDKPRDSAEALVQRQFVERQIAQRQTNAALPA